MAKRTYSDAETAEALIALAVNRFNFKKTARQLSIPEQTLRNWSASNVGAKKGVPELLERALERCLMRVDEVGSSDLPVLIGILMDKWLLSQGESTTRTENITRVVDALTDDQRHELYAETQRILAEADGGRATAGGPAPDGALERAGAA